MPPFKYWLTASAIYIALGALVALGTSIAGHGDKPISKVLAVLWIVSAGLVVFGLYNAATLAQRAEQQATLASRVAYVNALTRTYIQGHDGISSEMMGGLELPPEIWLNRELAKAGETWRVRNIRGPRFEIYELPPSGN
jgi:hypothetical protein